MVNPKRTFAIIATVASVSLSPATFAQTELQGEMLADALREDETSSTGLLPEILNPVDINSDEVQILSNYGLINSLQENALGVYISVNGPLISLYELQAVPFFDLATIRAILPVITISHANLRSVSLVKSFAHGKNEIILRLRHTLQRQKGYMKEGAFEGSRQGLFVRYTHTGQRFSLALIAEKDPGELWFDSQRKQLLDFQSFHIAIHRPLKWVDQIIVGDFTPSFGMGLVKSSAFTTGKSANTANILRQGMPLRPLRSAREYDFMRGIGISFTPHDKIKLHLSLSRAHRDATIKSRIGTNGVDSFEINTINGFPSSGYHRTASELSRKQNVVTSVIGLNSIAKFDRLRIEVSSLYQRTNIPVRITRRSEPEGQSTMNNSLGFRYAIQSLLLFGELALDAHGNTAMVTGSLIPLGKTLTVSLLYRNLSHDYEHPGARTFSENTKAENEYGIYAGIQLVPIKPIKINAYADHWRHPRARFGIDYPGSGTEFLIRATYSVRKKLEIYAQWRSEVKDYNADNSDSRLAQMTLRYRQYFRLHLSHKVNRNLELRNRIEHCRYWLGDAPVETGILILQDLLYKPLGKPFSVTGRIVYFQTDSYNSRLYAYENDLAYHFSIPAYAGNGTRFYLNLKYKGIRNTTVEFRLAHTQMFDRNVIGSGNDEVNGAGKTDVKMQFVYRF